MFVCDHFLHHFISSVCFFFHGKWKILWIGFRFPVFGSAVKCVSAGNFWTFGTEPVFFRNYGKCFHHLWQKCSAEAVAVGVHLGEHIEGWFGLKKVEAWTCLDLLSILLAALTTQMPKLCSTLMRKADHWTLPIHFNALVFVIKESVLCDILLDWSWHGVEICSLECVFPLAVFQW